MGVLPSQALLFAGIAAMCASAVRLASPAVPGGLERVLAAAAIAATAVVLETLGLGLLSLGGSAAALAAAAAATYAGTRALTPPPALAPAAELVAWLGAGSRRRRLAFAACAGAGIAWTGYLVRYPYIGIDGLTYHLGTVLAWIHSHRPGGLVAVLQGIPVENYPLTQEVQLTWLTAIGRNLAPAVAVYGPITALAGAGGWVALRSLDVPRRTAGLAVGALLALPLISATVNSVNTDTPALTWMLCAIGLGLSARTRPALAPCALLAAGLCVGTKPTPGPLLAVVLGTLLWSARARLRELRAPLVPALAAAAVTGGVWYVRDLLSHGSPLWPFVATPWGDPLPPALQAVHQSFLSRPGQLLAGRVDDYLNLLGGGALLLAGGLLAPLLAPTRRVALAALLTLAGTLSWASAPYTGILHPLLVSVGATRYLLPTLAIAAGALALAGADARGTRRLVAEAWLAVAAAWSALRLALFAVPLRPALGTLIAGALVGLALAAGARRLRVARLGRPAGLAAGAATAVAALAVSAHHFTARHATIPGLDSSLVSYMAVQPAWQHGGAPVWMGPAIDATLTGDRLGHRVPLVPSSTPCPVVRAHARRGWMVVLTLMPRAPEVRALLACLAGLQPGFQDGRFRVFGGGGEAPASAAAG